MSDRHALRQLAKLLYQAATSGKSELTKGCICIATNIWKMTQGIGRCADPGFSEHITTLIAFGARSAGMSTEGMRIGTPMFESINKVILCEKKYTRFVNFY